MTTKHTFSNGGFVLHGIPYGQNRMSAWFDSAGKVKDAEYRNALRSDSHRPVKRGGPMWKACEQAGRIHSSNPTH
jgi:hypothetical protein